MPACVSSTLCLVFIILQVGALVKKRWGSHGALFSSCGKGDVARGHGPDYALWGIAGLSGSPAALPDSVGGQERFDDSDVGMMSGALPADVCRLPGPGV